MWVSGRADISPATTLSKPDLWNIQPPIHTLSRSLSLDVKRPEQEADFPPTPSALIKNTRSYTSTFPYEFMTWYFAIRTILHQRISLLGTEETKGRQLQCMQNIFKPELRHIKTERENGQGKGGAGCLTRYRYSSLSPYLGWVANNVRVL